MAIGAPFDDAFAAHVVDDLVMSVPTSVKEIRGLPHCPPISQI
jgi:hypothetical protein